MTMRDRGMILIVVLAALAIVIPFGLLAYWIALPWGLIPGAAGAWLGAEAVIWMIDHESKWMPKR